MTMFDGACHCRAIRFQVDLPRPLEGGGALYLLVLQDAGAVVVSVPLDAFRLIEGADMLTRYTFNTGVAQHYFCRICGIYTHHRQRLRPLEFNVNVACLEGVSPFDFATVPVFDGVQHPRDLGSDAPHVRVGTLRFLPLDERATP